MSTLPPDDAPDLEEDEELPDGEQAVDALFADHEPGSPEALRAFTLALDLFEALMRGLPAPGPGKGEEVTPTGRALARLVGHMPSSAAREELGEMIASRLGLPTSSERRQRKLGLLVQLLDKSSSGDIPSAGTYDALRAERVAGGESWPSSQQLIDDFGVVAEGTTEHQGSAWARVCVQAMMDVEDLEGALRSDDLGYLQHGREAYELNELVTAVWEMDKAVGFSPSLWQYLAWAALRRRARRARGLQDERRTEGGRLPSQRPVYRLMEHHGLDWPAVQAQARRWGEEGVLPEG